MPSSTVEDYLKCIYRLQLEVASGEPVSTGQIASGLTVTPGTVTAMVKTLADAGLVAYMPYAGVRLTPAGLQLATHVLRRHRVVELFLVQVMGMSWSEVHQDAELLEHAVSDRIVERMDEMLGRPTTDPHGDPIPSPRGIVQETGYPTLLECPVNVPLRVTRVVDQDAEFLRLLERIGVRPGTPVRVEARDPAAETVRLAPAGGPPVSLGFRAAGKIRVGPAS